MTASPYVQDGCSTEEKPNCWSSHSLPIVTGAHGKIAGVANHPPWFFFLIPLLLLLACVRVAIKRIEAWTRFFFFHVSFPIWKFWMTIIVSSFVFLFIYQFTVSSFFSFVNIKFEVRLCVSFPSILLWYCYCRQNFGQLSFLRSFLYSFINLRFFSFVNIKFEVRLYASFQSILDSSFFPSFRSWI